MDNAIDLLDAIRPPWTDEQRAKFLEVTTQEALRVGMVGVHDARSFPKDVQFYHRMAKEGGLGLKLYLMVRHRDDLAHGRCTARTESRTVVDPCPNWTE